MKKFLVFTLITLIISCKKTENQKTNYTQIGIAYSGGIYENGSVHFNEYPYSDPDTKIEVKYIDSFKLSIKLNTKLNLPSYFKNFTANLNTVIGETKEAGQYIGYIMDKDSIQSGSISLFMSKVTSLVSSTLNISLVSKDYNKNIVIQSFKRNNN